MCVSLFFVNAVDRLNAAPPASGNQTSPGTQIKHDKQLRDNYRLESELKDGKPNIKVTIDSPQKKQVTLDDKSDAKALMLNKIIFTPESKILSKDELNQIISEYVGQKVSIRDLYKILAKIDALYDKKGFVARAVLPVQEVKDGIVKVQLVEAVIGKIDLSTHPQSQANGSITGLLDGKLLDRLGFKEKQLVNISRLERALLRFNLLNNSKLQLQLAPGQEVGQTNVKINTLHPKPFELSYFIDNAGRYTTGNIRQGASIRALNVLGIGDSLFATGILAEGGGSSSAFVQYAVPFTPYDTSLTFSFDYSDYQIVKGNLVALSITGRSNTYTVGVTQPIVFNNNTVLRLYSNVAFYNASNYFDKVQQASNQDVNITPGASLEWYGKKWTLTTDQSMSFGLTRFGGDDSYFLYAADFTAVYRPTNRWLFLGRFFGQITPDKILPANRQFVLGGVSTVRGYSEAILTGNSGYSARLEARFNAYRKNKGILDKRYSDSIDIFAFADHGGAFPYKGAKQSINRNDFLTSVGVGASFDISNYMKGRVSVGFPLSENTHERQTKSAIFNFYFQFNF